MGRDRLQRWDFNRQFSAYLSSMRPAILHAHFAGNGLRVIDVCERFMIPVVVTLRGFDASARLDDPLWRERYRRAFARFSAIATVSEDMLARLEPYLPADMYTAVIYSGKTSGDFPFANPTGPVERLLSVGRLVQKKGHLDAVEALRIARQQGFKGTLRIVGDGPLRDDLRAAIKTRGLENAVTLVGPLGKADLLKEYSEADAFILACRTAENGDQEGIPNTLKEAMLCGLPVISTRHAGIPELVPPEDHLWLAPEADPGSLASLMLRLAVAKDGEKVERARRSRAYVEKYFSTDREVTQYLQLYEAVLSLN